MLVLKKQLIFIQVCHDIGGYYVFENLAKDAGPEVIKRFSCSTELSLKFSLLITTVGIFIFISREISCSAIFNKIEFVVVTNLRFISMKHFMLS